MVRLWNLICVELRKWFSLSNTHGKTVRLADDGNHTLTFVIRVHLNSLFTVALHFPTQFFFACISSYPIHFISTQTQFCLSIFITLTSSTSMDVYYSMLSLHIPCSAFIFIQVEILNCLLLVTLIPFAVAVWNSLLCASR